MIVPFEFHDPPLPEGASQMGRDVPSSKDAFINLPLAKYAIYLLSGDQNGYASYVALVRALEVSELIGLTHNFSSPDESTPTNDMY